MHAPIMTEQAIITAWVTSMTRRRSTRSDTAPAKRLKKRQGTQAAMLTSPTTVSEELFRTNQRTAVDCSQVPTLETKAPVQYMRKGRD